jgi:putative NIF3 family GTP cyclohydrolase 1 type 2
LLLTGEMRHHDVLDLAQKGTSVILTDHTHSERGYLPHLRSRILAQAPDLEVHISGADLEPLEIV